MNNQELANQLNQWMMRIRSLCPSVAEVATVTLPLANIVNEMGNVRDALVRDTHEPKKAEEE